MGLITSLPALTAVQVLAISEALHEGYFKNPEMQKNHNFVEGIQALKQIIIFGAPTGLAGEVQASCGTTPNSTWSIPSSEKTWTPKYWGDRFAECYDDYMAKFVAWTLKEATEKPDLTGTALAAFIIENLDRTIYDIIMRIVYFNDTGIVAGTGNNLTAGNVKFFNQQDGLWAQIADIITADANRLSTTGLTTKNAQVTFAAQKFSSTDTTNQVVTNALQQMWYDADMRLRSTDKSQLQFLVTQTVYDQYERERKATGGSAIIEVFRRTEDGIQNLMSDGIEVVPMPVWDRIIQTYLEDGTVWTLPHRAILTTRTNLMIGTESVGKLGMLDPFHSKDDKKYYIDFGFSLDAKVGLDNMIQLAY